MEDLRKADLDPQVIVADAPVEDQRVRALRQPRDSQEVVAPQVGDEDTPPRGDVPGKGLSDVGLGGDHVLDQLVAVAEEAAGGLIVLDRQAGAPDAGVLDHRVDKGQRQPRFLHAGQEHDGDIKSLGG
jgi:hypothetical protein